MKVSLDPDSCKMAKGCVHSRAVILFHQIILGLLIVMFASSLVPLIIGCHMMTNSASDWIILWVEVQRLSVRKQFTGVSKYSCI